MKQSNHYLPAPAAVIDIGTNTLRLLIGCIKDGKVVRMATDRVITRIGKGISKSGSLNTDNVEKSITSIAKFKALCEKFRVQKIIAVGTSALRETKESSEFLERAKRDAGMDIKIISGQKEAELTLQGALSGTIQNETPSFIVDIGGGSTEWILYDSLCSCPLYGLEDKVQGPGDRSRRVESALKLGSVNLGAVRLFETFIRYDPPALSEIEEMKGYICDKFSEAIIHTPASHHSPLSLIATGGTATTIAAIDMGLGEYDGDKVHLHKTSFSAVKAIFEELIGLTLGERSKIKGLLPERADIIIPGTLILLTLMEILEIREVIVSDYGLLEGLLIASAIGNADR
ncbi:Ppx/GppA family phosphatase [Thermodesulfovibrionales bacterium]|nr:Ppx/GppA family phosphatase [Thermodesulfovibrionales bacterium]